MSGNSIKSDAEKLTLPPIVFGTSCLGNLYAAVPEATKERIAENWLRYSPSPITLDSAGKYGAGMALEVMGRNLKRLGVSREKVLISNKLGWFRVPLKGAEPTFEKGVWEGLTHDAEQRISRRGILECWEQGCELLGDYRPQLLSVHDPDEYLAAACGAEDRLRRRQDILEAYESLFELKARGEARAIGVGSKDWRVIRELAREIRFDWVMLACSFTILQHPPELLEFIEELRGKGTLIINSAVFHAGFLTGGKFFDYRVLSPGNPADAPLFAWRERFMEVCTRHAVKPAAACVQFGLSAPGIRAVALNTGNPDRIAENVEFATLKLPAEFWADIRRAGLVSPSYPHL